MAPSLNKAPSVRLYFEKRDLWVGVFWTRERFTVSTRLVVYICPLPMLVIRLTFPEEYVPSGEAFS